MMTMINAEPNSSPVTAASAETIRDEVRSIYEALDREIADLGPLCQLSGRCCRFAEYGHTLFLSEPEFDLLLREAPAPSRPLDDGETCPWQDLRGRCTAREARPLGCRVYFCDPRHEPHAPELSERFLARLKRMAERHKLPWNYAPLHRHTHQAVEEGRLVTEAVPAEVIPIGSV
jgi:Fe-S-cluster containining protein